MPKRPYILAGIARDGEHYIVCKIDNDEQLAQIKFKDFRSLETTITKWLETKQVFSAKTCTRKSFRLEKPFSSQKRLCPYGCFPVDSEDSISPTQKARQAALKLAEFFHLAEAIPKQHSYLMTFKATSPSDARHSFTGAPPRIKHGTDWPICGRCRSSMTHVLQFNPSEADSSKENMNYALFYCFACCFTSPAYEPGSQENTRIGWDLLRYAPDDKNYTRAKKTPDSEVPIANRSISYAQSTMIPDFHSLVDWTLVPDDKRYPVNCSERPIPPHPQKRDFATLFDFASKNGWDRDRSSALAVYYRAFQHHVESYQQIGTYLYGFPRWRQLAFPAFCSQCHKPMQVLASIESNEDIGLEWLGGGRAYIQQCPAHLEEFSFIIDWED